MNSIFNTSIILTKRFTRYGGDAESILGLVVNHKGSMFLYFEGDEIKLLPITSSPEYIKWLLDNHMDLLLIAEDNDFMNIYNDWYNDRSIENGRRIEFQSLIKSL